MSLMPAAPIRILVVDDHTLFRRGLTALLARDDHLQVVGDAADAGEALRRAQELQPDLILLDNHLPGVNGVDALPGLREAVPGVAHPDAHGQRGRAGSGCGIARRRERLPAEDDRGRRAGRRHHPRDARRVGGGRGNDRQAGGGVPRRRGCARACRPRPAEPASPLAHLSPREQEILRAIARGASNKEIGRELGIAETTVKIHVQHVLRKLDVSSRVQAAVIASEHGLV